MGQHSVRRHGEEPAGAEWRDLNELFSNASRPGFPPGLEVGKRYEISVQLEVASGGELHGRSRTFFEFAPLPVGGSNVAVYLPSVGTDGKFKFDVEVKSGEKIAIDPVVAIGYDYEIGSGDLGALVVVARRSGRSAVCGSRLSPG